MRRILLLALPMVGLVVYAGWLGMRGGPAAENERETADPLAEGWRRVAARPEAPQAWLRLAERQIELDQAAAAERSLWTAIELGDPGGFAHARLGFLLYAQHRDDEALALLEVAREREVSLPLLDHTLTVLQARARAEEAAVAEPAAAEPADDPPPERPPPAPRSPEPRPDAGVPLDAGPRPDPGPEPLLADDAGGPCDLPLDRIDGGRTFALEVDVEGVPARLIVDTGASLTVLTRELADELGVRLDAQRSITAITANGRVEMPTAVLARVAVGDRAVRELRVAVCDDCVSDLADGLLGLDLQTTLGMQIDAGAARLRFGDCDP